MSEKNLVRFLVIGALVCLTGIMGYFMKGGSRESSTQEMIDKVAQAQSQMQTESGNGSAYTQSRPVLVDFLSEKETASVDTLTKMISQALERDLSTKGFIDLINSSGLRPTATTSKNPDTGSLTTVRTSNALEGTRYFHAQFFGGEKMKDFPQHISFEIRPSKNTMEVATQFVEKNFKGNLIPTVSRPDFKSWDLKSGDTTVWIKILDQDDVLESPINPRELSDIGGAWIAVEHKIHDKDHDD